MTERDAFIRRICEEPDEDTHRLVFADWCDENGLDGWARLIRYAAPVQHWRAKPGRWRWAHTKTLVDGGKPTWLGLPRPAWYAQQLVGAGLRRAMRAYTVEKGFVSSVEVAGYNFLRRPADFFREHPITRVYLFDRMPDVADLRHDAPWVWHSGEDDMTDYRMGDSILPPYLFALLPRNEFDSVTEAHLALSVACVAYGRARAGLPQLP